MIFCARATRGLGRPSPGLMARLGVPVGGRVRRLRAVEDQSGPIPERERASLEGGDREQPDHPSCSQNAHDETVLVRCAQ